MLFFVTDFKADSDLHVKTGQFFTTMLLNDLVKQLPGIISGYRFLNP